MRTVGTLLVAICFAIIGAGARAASDGAYRAVEALYAEGRPAEGRCTLIALLARDPAEDGPLDADDAAVLRRIAEAASETAVASARRGQRDEALQTVAAVMSLGRRTMDGPDVMRANVEVGLALCLIAGRALGDVWDALGDPASDAGFQIDLAALEGVARNVIAPRCAAMARAAGSDPRRERAESRALVRLWEYHLVRAAADNLD